jgi:hypothetical protein
MQSRDGPCHARNVNVLRSESDPRLVSHPRPVLTSYDYVFAENGLVAHKDGAKLAVQSLKTFLGEEKLKVGVINLGGSEGAPRWACTRRRRSVFTRIPASKPFTTRGCTNLLGIVLAGVHQLLPALHR